MFDSLDKTKKIFPVPNFDQRHRFNMQAIECAGYKKLHFVTSGNPSSIVPIKVHIRDVVKLKRENEAFKDYDFFLTGHEAILYPHIERVGEEESQGTRMRWGQIQYGYGAKEVFDYYMEDDILEVLDEQGACSVAERRAVRFFLENEELIEKVRSGEYNPTKIATVTEIGEKA